MIKVFMKRSKKGITLVESVIAVVLLAFAASGILTLLLSSGTKILQISADSSAYSEATQRMDYIISAISNGCNPHYDTGDLNVAQLLEDLSHELDGISASDIEARTEFFENVDEFPKIEGDVIGNYIHGWYLKLTYDGVTVEGFAANSEGVFDH